MTQLRILLLMVAGAAPLSACGDTVNPAEGLSGGGPITGNGGSAALGGSVNPNGGSVPEDKCRVTVDNHGYVESFIYSYDSSSRHLSAGWYDYDLDDQLRVYKVYGDGEIAIESGQKIYRLYWTDQYDEHGNLVQSAHYSTGIRSYTNTYEVDRLVQVEASGQGLPPVLTRLSYEDESVPDAWTRRENRAFDGSLLSVDVRSFAFGKASTASVLDASGRVAKSWTLTYVAGRIDVVENDGGYTRSPAPDGTPDLRFKWQRDNAGTVTEFTQDGFFSNDDSVVDGVPDYSENYSPGCRPLLEQFPWLAHEPIPDGYAPYYRVSSF